MVWLAYTLGHMDIPMTLASSSLHHRCKPTVHPQLQSAIARMHLLSLYCTAVNWMCLCLFLLCFTAAWNIKLEVCIALHCMAYIALCWTMLNSTVGATVIRGTKTVDHEMSPHWSNWCCTLCSTSSMCRSCSYRWGRPNQNTSRTILQQQQN